MLYYEENSRLFEEHVAGIALRMRTAHTAGTPGATPAPAWRSASGGDCPPILERRSAASYYPARPSEPVGLPAGRR
jgi:hypothetical protein